MANISPRFKSYPMSSETAELSHKIRVLASELENLYMKLPQSRARSLALTDLETSVMWINKALSTKTQKTAVVENVSNEKTDDNEN